jgi:DNA sulfur modification protein DndD
VAKDAISDATLALSNYEKTTADMLAESEKLGLVEIAHAYKDVSTRIGKLRGNVESMKGTLAKKQAFISETEERILNLQSLSQKDSKLNKRLELILVTRKIILEYAAQRRESLANPLEKGFSEGFKLLSRKASVVESVQISATDYSPSIKMKGYDGNWLDRDLSATEKQHVGLSMLYAICKLSRTALPVVVDTPVSRMDKEHKSWSVTKFYPKLSHQVIVLTTSDDLGAGLFDELKKTGCIGSQILLKETGPATVEAVTTTLEDFF